MCAGCARSGYAFEADIGERLVVKGIMNADANTRCGGGQLSRYRGATLAMLLIAIIVVEVPKYIVILFVPQGVALRCAILCCQVLMACLPFVLARIAPTVAGFDRQWLPPVWSQWLWFPGLVLLLLIVYGLHDLAVGVSRRLVAHLHRAAGYGGCCASHCGAQWSHPASCSPQLLRRSFGVLISFHNWGN